MVYDPFDMQEQKTSGYDPMDMPEELAPDFSELTRMRREKVKQQRRRVSGWITARAEKHSEAYSGTNTMDPNSPFYGDLLGWRDKYKAYQKRIDDGESLGPDESKDYDKSRKMFDVYNKMYERRKAIPADFPQAGKKINESARQRLFDENQSFNITDVNRKVTEQTAKEVLDPIVNNVKLLAEAMAKPQYGFSGALADAAINKAIQASAGIVNGKTEFQRKEEAAAKIDIGTGSRDYREHFYKKGEPVPYGIDPNSFLWRGVTDLFQSLPIIAPIARAAAKGAVEERTYSQNAWVHGAQLMTEGLAGFAGFMISAYMTGKYTGAASEKLFKNKWLQGVAREVLQFNAYNVLTDPVGALTPEGLSTSSVEGMIFGLANSVTGKWQGTTLPFMYAIGNLLSIGHEIKASGKDPFDLMNWGMTLDSNIGGITFLGLAKMGQVKLKNNMYKALMDRQLGLGATKEEAKKIAKKYTSPEHMETFLEDLRKVREGVMRACYSLQSPAALKELGVKYGPDAPGIVEQVVEKHKQMYDFTDFQMKLIGEANENRIAVQQKGKAARKLAEELRAKRYEAFDVYDRLVQNNETAKASRVERDIISISRDIAEAEHIGQREDVRMATEGTKAAEARKEMQRLSGERQKLVDEAKEFMDKSEVEVEEGRMTSDDVTSRVNEYENKLKEIDDQYDQHRTIRDRIYGGRQESPEEAKTRRMRYVAELNVNSKERRLIGADSALRAAKESGNADRIKRATEMRDKRVADLETARRALDEMSRRKGDERRSIDERRRDDRRVEDKGPPEGTEERRGAERRSEVERRIGERRLGEEPNLENLTEAEIREMAAELGRQVAKYELDPELDIINGSAARMRFGAFMEKLEKEGYQFIMIDGDNLHKINHAFEGGGNAEGGTNMLKGIVETLVDAGIPKEDIIRWGGDEFVVITKKLPETLELIAKAKLSAKEKKYNGRIGTSDQVGEVTGVGFSSGAGKTIAEANKTVGIDKEKREAAGERAGREDIPENVKHIDEKRRAYEADKETEAVAKTRAAKTEEEVASATAETVAPETTDGVSTTGQRSNGMTIAEFRKKINQMCGSDLPQNDPSSPGYLGSKFLQRVMNTFFPGISERETVRKLIESVIPKSDNPPPDSLFSITIRDLNTARENGMVGDGTSRMLDDMAYWQKADDLFYKATKSRGVRRTIFELSKILTEDAPDVAQLRSAIRAAESKTGYKMFTPDWNPTNMMNIEAMTIAPGVAKYPGTLTWLTHRFFENADAVYGKNTKEQFRTDIVKSIEAEYAKDPTSVSRSLRKIGNGAEFNLFSALRAADKTGAGINLNSNCPTYTFGNAGCYGDRCYVLDGLARGNALNMYNEAPYLGEVLMLSDKDVKSLNKAGGIRINNVGDTIGLVSTQWRDFIHHAAIRGLDLKVITKQPSTLDIVSELHNPESVLYEGMTREAIDATVKKAKDINVQVTVDPYWVSIDKVSVEKNSPLGNNTKLGKMYRDAIDAFNKTGNLDGLKVVADEYGEQTGRAAKVLDNGEIQVKYGFSGDQIRKYINNPNYKDLKITVRAVVSTPKEIAEYALHAPDILQTWMHTSGKTGMFSDVEGRMLDPSEILNFSRNPFIDARKKIIRGVTRDGKMVTGNFKIVEDYIKNNYTPEQQDTIFKNLAKNVCAQKGGNKNFNKSILKKSGEKSIDNLCMTCVTMCGDYFKANPKELSQRFGQRDAKLASGEMENNLYSQHLNADGEVLRRAAVKFGEDNRAVVHGLMGPTAIDSFHEFSHIIERHMPDPWRKEAENIFGVKDGNWNAFVQGDVESPKTYREMFADGFVEWLRTGRTPAGSRGKVRQMFEKIKEILMNAMEDAILGTRRKSFKETYGFDLGKGAVELYELMAGKNERNWSKTQKEMMKRIRGEEVEQRRAKEADADFRAEIGEISKAEAAQEKVDLAEPNVARDVVSHWNNLSVEVKDFADRYYRWMKDKKSGPEPEPDPSVADRFDVIERVKSDIEFSFQKDRDAELEAKRNELRKKIADRPNMSVVIQATDFSPVMGKGKLEELIRKEDPDAQVVNITKSPDDLARIHVTSRLTGYEITKITNDWAQERRGRGRYEIKEEDEIGEGYESPFLASLGGKQSVGGGVTIEVTQAAEAQRSVYSEVLAAAGQTGRIQPDLIKGHRPPRRLHAVFDLQRVIGRKVYQEKLALRQNLGEMDPRSGISRVRYTNDLDSVAHELAGHVLDDMYGITKFTPGQAGTLDAELIPTFSQFASPANDIVRKRAEGFAEWIRSWLVNPKETEKLSPNFTKHFKEAVGPKVVEGLRQFGDTIRKMHGATDLDAFKSNVDWSHLKHTGFLSDIYARLIGRPPVVGYHTPWYTRWFSDRVKPLMRMLDAVYDLKEQHTGLGPKPMEDARLLARQFNGVGTKIMRMLREGIYHPNKPVGDRASKLADFGFDDMLRTLDVSNKKNFVSEYEDMVAYSSAQRIIELSLRPEFTGKDIIGIRPNKSDLDTAHGIMKEIDNMKRSNPEKFKRIDEASKKFREWGNALMKYAYLRGRISKETYKDVIKNNQFHIAFQRIMEVEGDGVIDWNAHRGGSAAAGINDLGKHATVVKRIKGSMKDIKDPLESALIATQRIITESDKNYLLQQMVKAAQVKERFIHEGEAYDMAQFMHRVQPGEKGNTFDVWVDGVKQTWKVPDPHVYKALMGIKDTNMRVNGLFSLPARILRGMVVHSPEFYVRNFARDTIRRMIVSQHGASAPTLLLTKRGEELVREYELYGGGQEKELLGGAGWGWDWHKEVQKRMKEVVNDRSVVTMPIDGIRWFAKKYHKAAMSSEILGRIPEYSKAYKYAKEKLKYDDLNAGMYAASHARGLLDFAICGEYMRVINQIFPFTNAGIQGLKRDLHALSRGNMTSKAAFMAKWSMWVLLPEVSARYLSQSMGREEEYEGLPAWRKMMFWNIPFPGGKDTRWLVIPKPFELGTMATGAYLTAKRLLGDKRALEGVGPAFIQGILPFKVDMFATGPWSGLYEAFVTDYDSFRGKEIVGWEKNVPPEDRTGEKERASALGKVLRTGMNSVLGGIHSLRVMVGEKTPEDARPYVDARSMDHAIRSMTGTLGSDFMGISDLIAGDKPSWKAFDPLKLTGIVKEGPGYGHRDVQWVLSYYKNVEKTKPPQEFKDAVTAFFEAKTREQARIAERRLYGIAASLRRSKSRKRGAR